MKYQRRPEVVDAMQVTRDNRNLILTWMGEPKNEEQSKVVPRSFDPRNIMVKCFDGEQKLAVVGDYVIKHSPNDFDVMPREYFEMQYEPAKGVARG